MIVEALEQPVERFEAESGWKLRPEGACRGDQCVPLPADAVRAGRVDLSSVCGALGMPIVHDPEQGLYSIGPPSGAPVLTSAVCPEIRLPDLAGDEFSLSSLRGRKVILVAWASW